MPIPRVSVLMPVWNEERFLRQAIDSVLGQTYADFELLIVNDGSTDRTREIITSYRDARVRLVDLEANVGVPRALNRGLSEIRSEYVALGSGNDIWVPAWLARQVAFLDAHPDVAAAGAQARLINTRGALRGRTERRPVSSVAIRWCQLFGTPLIHSGAMFRRAVLESLGGYDETFRVGTDADLFRRIAAGHRLGNLPERLIDVRLDPCSLSGNVNHERRKGYDERRITILHVALQSALGTEVPRRWVALWSDAQHSARAMPASDLRELIHGIERCAARFEALHPEAAGEAEVHAHQAFMMGLAAQKAATSARLLSIAIWWKVTRRHTRTALRMLPKYAALFLCGEGARTVWRRVRPE